MFEEIFEKYGLENQHEIITEITPKGYNINSLMVELDEIGKYPDKTQITVFGYIDKFESKAMNGRKSLTRISCKLYKDGKSTNCFWVVATATVRKVLFGLEKQAPEGNLIQVTGKVSSFEGSGGFRITSIEQPKLNALSEDTSSSQRTEGFIVPEAMYRLKQDITSFKLKNAFRVIIKDLDKYKEKYKLEFLPESLEKEMDLQPLKKSLEFMHGMKPIPIDKFEDFINYTGFNKRVSAERIWSIILSSFLDAKEQPSSKMNITNEDIEILKKISELIPFELTEDQKKTIWNLLKVFSDTLGSRSLVFGDVGSGKTMVAMFLSYILYKKGYQVAIITPTSILTKQHYEEFVKFLGEKDVFIVHSKTKAKEKEKLNNHLRKGLPAIVLGTTSANSLEFTNVGAVFIDEEQKMGVHAKEKIVKQFNNEPHLIFMTATPIPRTLAASIYTNFHVFQIRNKPKNRLPRITKILDIEESYKEEYQMILKRLQNKEQALVIIPSIDSNELANVTSTRKKYSNIFKGITIKSIHGRMDKKEVEEIIEDYMNGKFELLIATVMVDSGFSNKNLSFVFIENADRFGIAQLHQIRGRCGRGELQGHCYLVPTSFKKMKELTAKRLNYVSSSEDGFELSEFDLSLRGSGDLKGEEQSGTEMNLIEWVNEIEIMKNYIKENIIKEK